ncbi:MAG: hypothetical protein AAF197_12055 [Pseudomonadota bacterium]
MTICLSTASSAQVAVIPLAGEDQIEVARVSVNYDVTFEVANCATYGGNTCYEGGETALCPEGMKVIGGGASATNNGRFGHINVSRPSFSNTGWICRSTYDISASSVGTCYAICVTTKEPSVPAIRPRNLDLDRGKLELEMRRKQLEQ